MADQNQKFDNENGDTNSEAPNKEFSGEAPGSASGGSSSKPMGTAKIGKDSQLTPERAAEGDRDESDAV
jgi:hypothetical protein